MNLQEGYQAFNQQAVSKTKELMDSSTFAYITAQMTALKEVGANPEDYELVIIQDNNFSELQTMKILYSVQIRKINNQ